MMRPQRLSRALPGVLAVAAALAPTVVALTLAAAPAGAAVADDPIEQSPFGGRLGPPLLEPRSQRVPPAGFALSAAEAIAIASRTEVVRTELAESPGPRPVADRRGDRWEVLYRDRGAPVAEVIIDGQSGAVDEAWRDFQVETPLARGYSGAIAQKVNAPYVWLALCLLWVVPFIDFRRPLRLVHIDLAVLLGLGISLFFFNRAEITASVLLTYPVLGYFLARMLVAGLRPRRREGPLIPRIPIRWLAVAVFALVAGRIALNLLDSHVIDIGAAGVIGADRIADGRPLYEGGFSPGLDLRGDVYGPFNYLAYLPFVQLLGWDGVWDADLPAAHAAAIFFDLCCVVGLWVLGRRLRDGEQGRALGWALAFAWVACPWTLYTMNANANDALIAALAIGSLIALRSPPARGALVALAAAAKFGSAALAPLFATADGERRGRQVLGFAIAFAAVGAVAFLPFVPDSGLRGMYDRTLGYQAARGSPFSIWGQAPSLDGLQPLVRAAAASLAVGVAFYPRRKSAVQIAALAAAVTIAVQLTANHWFYFYVVWFLPFVLVASFAEREAIIPGTEAANGVEAANGIGRP